jgi:circadian clock protein KaiB
MNPVEIKTITAQLRLYIARSTPNSMRAEQNLVAALKEMNDAGSHIAVEFIDVFTHPKRAITEGIIVTPTLVVITANGRTTMMGDLTDSGKLEMLLRSL